MSNPRFVSYIKGYVRIRVTGTSYERFLNICAKHGIIIWDLEYVKNAYEMNLSIADFKKLRPLVKKSHTRVSILRRYGFPFFLFRYRKRKLLFIGMTFGFALMFFLSSFVWDISISGNHARTEDVIFDFLREEEVNFGSRKSKIDCKELAAKLRREFDDFIWVAVRMQGTRLFINVQENTDLELRERIDYGPSDLVANRDGMVEKIITRAGIPQVKAGDTVKKGDILVKGEVEVIDDSGEVAKRMYCAADADIYLKTTYHYRKAFPLEYEEKEYTGEMRKGFFLRIWGKTFAFAGRKNPKEKADTVTSEYQARLAPNFYLPLSIGRIERREYKISRKRYTKKAAFSRAEKELSQFLEKIQEKGVQIFENNVKIEEGKKECVAEGDLIVIEKSGRRVERKLKE